MLDRSNLRRLLLLAAALGPAAGRRAAAARQRLTLATGAVPPLVSAPPQVGFLDALAAEVFGRLGIDVTLVSMPLERELINADAGIEDGVMMRAPGFEKDYPNLLRVPETVLDFHLVAYTARPDVQVRDWNDLARYSVAYITGWKAVEARLKAVSEVTAVRNVDQLLTLLANGRADVVVLGRWQGFVQKAREAGLPLRALDPPLAQIPMYSWLHRRHAALVQPLSQALAQVKRDGTWQRLYDQILLPLERPR